MAGRVGAVCTLALLVSVVSARAAIVPQRGIAGLALGMTQARVQAKLGGPRRIVRGTNAFGSYTEFVYPGLRVSFQGNTSVTNLRTTRRAERTTRGAGVGSTEAALRRAVRGLRCRTESGLRHCFLGRFRAGRRVTDFRLRAGRVVSVDVGFVID